MYHVPLKRKVQKGTIVFWLPLIFEFLSILKLNKYSNIPAPS